MSINPACRYCTNYDKKRLDCKQKMYSLLYSGAGIKPLCLEMDGKYRKHPLISKLRMVIRSRDFLEACWYAFIIAWSIVTLLALTLPEPYKFAFIVAFCFFVLATMAGFFAYIAYTQIYKPVRKQWKFVDSLFIEPMKTDRKTMEDIKNGN